MIGQSFRRTTTPGPKGQPRGRELSPARTERSRAAVLLTENAVLAESVALLAAGAAVELAVVSRRAQWEGPPPLLWLADPVALPAAGRFSRAEPLVLVALTEDAPAAWKAAESRGGAPVALLPDGGAWLVSRMAALSGCGEEGRLVGVVSASGGSGSTTLTALLASHLAEGGTKVLAAEGDPLGFGLEQCLSSGGAHGVRWEDLTGVHGVLNPQELWEALPKAGRLPFLARRSMTGCFPAGDAADSVISAVRSASPLALVDIGHGFKTPGSLVDHCDSFLLLVPPTPRGVAAGRDLCGVLGAGRTRCVVVQREGRGRGRSPERIARSLGVPLAGCLPFRRDIVLADRRQALPALSSIKPVRRIGEEVMTCV